MIVHFICAGNVYRSRLAESYFNSKVTKGLTCFSSGIVAGQDLIGPISWLAERIIQKNNLAKYMSFSFQKTSKELLDKADYTIFMEKYMLDFCKKEFGYNIQNYEIWNIPDLILIPGVIEAFEKDVEKIRVSEETFEDIKQKVNKLIIKLQRV